MWFKNLILYRIVDRFDHGPEQVADALASRAFRPCGSMDTFTYGWDRALGRAGSELVHAVGGTILVSACREEKILPPAVVNEAVEHKVEQIEAGEPRKVRRKERMRIKDEVVFGLLPRAFTRQVRTRAFIAPKAGWVVVDAAAPRKADDLVTLLTDSLPALKFEPWMPALSPVGAMTRWLTSDGAPPGFEIQQDCELRDPSDERAVVRCQRQDLASEEIHTHLRAGKHVRALSLGYGERLSFVLTGDMHLKRIRYEAVDELDDMDGLDEIARLDANFAFMVAELGGLLGKMLEVFGED